MALHLHPDCRLGQTLAMDLVPYLRDATGISPEDAGQMARGRLHATCLAHRLIRPNDIGRFPAYFLTPAGAAIKSAVFAPRRTAAEADRIFAELLDRMSELNREALIRIPGFWLYGSQMRRERMIGDIDLILDWERAPGVDVTELETRLRRSLSREGRSFRGGRDEVLEAFLRDRLIPEEMGRFLSIGCDSFELRMLGAPCQFWTLEDSYTPGPILPRHPQADASPDIAGLTILTDRGPYRSRVPPEAELRATIATAIRNWVGQGAGTVIPGPEFGGLFRDVEMLTGRAPDHPLWQAIGNLAELEAGCRDIQLEPEILVALAAGLGADLHDPDHEQADVPSP